MLSDLSYVPAPDETPQAIAVLVEHIRRIGVQRFLFGSDFNVLTPLQEIKNIDRLGLSKKEFQTLRQNCAPWAKRNTSADLIQHNFGGRSPLGVLPAALWTETKGAVVYSRNAVGLRS
jgi:hypothetical protein